VRATTRHRLSPAAAEVAAVRTCGEAVGASSDMAYGKEAGRDGQAQALST
jgi:hypothetical protein